MPADFGSSFFSRVSFHRAIVVATPPPPTEIWPSRTPSRPARRCSFFGGLDPRPAAKRPRKGKNRRGGTIDATSLAPSRRFPHRNTPTRRVCHRRLGTWLDFLEQPDRHAVSGRRTWPPAIAVTMGTPIDAEHIDLQTLCWPRSGHHFLHEHFARIYARRQGRRPMLEGKPLPLVGRSNVAAIRGPATAARGCVEFDPRARRGRRRKTSPPFFGYFAV